MDKDILKKITTYTIKETKQLLNVISLFKDIECLIAICLFKEIECLIDEWKTELYKISFTSLEKEETIGEWREKNAIPLETYLESMKEQVTKAFYKETVINKTKKIDLLITSQFNKYVTNNEGQVFSFIIDMIEEEVKKGNKANENN